MKRELVPNVVVATVAFSMAVAAKRGWANVSLLESAWRIER